MTNVFRHVQATHGSIGPTTGTKSWREADNNKKINLKLKFKKLQYISFQLFVIETCCIYPTCNAMSVDFFLDNWKKSKRLPVMFFSFVERESYFSCVWDKSKRICLFATNWIEQNLKLMHFLMLFKDAYFTIYYTKINTFKLNTPNTCSTIFKPYK